jgi:hypothetical protein
MKLAAIYARVSSDQQREEHTIASQTEALVEFAKRNDFNVPQEWIKRPRKRWTAPGQAAIKSLRSSLQWREHRRPGE